MNKINGIFFFVLMAVSVSGSKAQSIKILFSSGFEVSVAEYTKFTFLGKDGEKYSGKIHICNDSQFTFYNYFDELSKDTMHLNFVQGVKGTESGGKYKIRPVWTALAILAYPITLVAVPVLIVKLILNKGTKSWVDRTGFTISISMPKPDQEDI